MYSMKSLNKTEIKPKIFFLYFYYFYSYMDKKYLPKLRILSKENKNIIINKI